MDTCFAGKWAMHNNNINAMVLTASMADISGPLLLSNESLKRTGGCAFTAALIELATEGPQEYQLFPYKSKVVLAALSKDEKPAYARFVRDLQRAISYTDIGYAEKGQGLLFSAQNDECEEKYSVRIGTLYSTFLNNLNKLEDYRSIGSVVTSTDALDRGTTPAATVAAID
jgi:hypothetical protein